jgi:replicative DNA helicase
MPEIILSEFLQKNPNIIEMENYFQSSLDDYDSFDKKAWAKGNGYFSPNFKIFNDRLEGLDEGLYIFAGEANSGKSAFMMNVMFDYCIHKENQLFGIFYSLDDSRQDIIARLIAMNESIPISAANKPQRYQDIIDRCLEGSAQAKELLKKRKKGLEHLKAVSQNFKVIDGEKITCAEQLINHAKNVQAFVKSRFENGNIIVGIDSMSDLEFSSKIFKSDVEKNDHVAKTAKKWAATELKVPVFGSLHLRKLNQNRRPTTDDVKSSGRYMYEANALFLIHNDTNRNKQATQVFWRESPESDLKFPVIELDWAKNKKSSYKGHTFYYFYPSFSSVIECDEEDAKRYLALIYTN